MSLAKAESIIDNIINNFPDYIDMAPKRQVVDTTAIVRQLEEDIVLGMLHPRERLVEDDLMARFQVRRHVVRAALAELVQMGMVVHRKNIGALVRGYALDEVKDLYDMRELMEGEAIARMTCPADGEDIERLEALQATHDAAVESGDPRAIFRANSAFHAAFFALCPNKVLADAVQYFTMQTHAIRSSSARSPKAQRQSRQDHAAMIRALKHGRRQELMRLSRAHIRPALEEYLALNKQHLQ